MFPSVRLTFLATSAMFAVLSAHAVPPAPSESAPRVSIAYASARTPDGRALHEGEVVTVIGAANIDSGVLYADVVKFFIEDADAGIAVFTRRKLAPVHAGDIVRVAGRITRYGGAVEIIADDVAVLSHGRPPAPQLVRGSDIVTGRYYGRLVQVEGQVIEAVSRWRGYEVRLHVGRDLITLRLTDAQKKSFRTIQQGETINVIGISSVYAGGQPPRISWEILPRGPADVKVVEARPLFTRDDAMKAALIGVVLIILVLLWNFALGLRVRRETREHRESEGRFSAVAETAPVAIFIYQDSVFRYVNAAAEQITGYSTHELIGRPFWDIVDPEFRQMIHDRGQARLRGEHVDSRYEFRILRKDGVRVWLDFSATQILYNGVIAALGTAFDITERKESEERLRTSERRFRGLVEHSSDGVALLNHEGEVIWAGPSTQRILGVTEQQLVGLDLVNLIHADDLPGVQHGFSSIIRSGSGESVTVACRARGGEGEWRWFEATLTNLLDEPAVGAVVSNYRDITERKKAEEEMRHQALHDTLTALPNRSLYHDRLGLALAHSRRSGRPLAVMFVDLDLFKLVNDSAGHTAGDAVLRETGRRLLECVRASDTVARVGGDEFTVIVEDIEGVDSITRIADAILETVSKPFVVENHELHITASIGISLFPSDGDDVDTLTRNADKAMYRAKELGRHNAQLFTADMNERYRARVAFEAGFRLALQRQEFVVHYQPIFAASGHVAGVEALVRWNDPTRGLVYPDDFIPAAEETRMILPLGAWVLRCACDQVVRWSNDSMPRLTVSVNLSVRQFHQRDLVHSIDAVLRDTGLEPERLVLEITESAAMQNLELTRTILQQLRSRGVKIAIDDFGAGHTSLMYLRQFPITSIKIDRTFVKNATATAADAAIVTAIIRLAHDLGLTVTGEGVETEEQRQFLLSERCDFLQGYLLSRPVPPEKVRMAVGEPPVISARAQFPRV